MRTPLRPRPRSGTPDEPAATGVVAATRRRFRRRQRARRWVVLRRVLLALAAVAALLVGGWLLLFSSVLAVTGADVRGVHLLSRGEVATAAAVPVGVPLARADLAAVQARVEALPEVRAAEVSRSWPHTLRIDVTERTPVAVVAWEGRWRALDREGVLFRAYAERPAGLLEVTMRATTPAEALAEAAGVVAGLPDDLRARVRSVHVTSIDAITLTLQRGALVRWGSNEQSDRKAEVLRLLLKRPARVYDVTAPGRPTLRG